MHYMFVSHSKKVVVIRMLSIMFSKLIIVDLNTQNISQKVTLVPKRRAKSNWDEKQHLILHTNWVNMTESFIK